MLLIAVGEINPEPTIVDNDVERVGFMSFCFLQCASYFLVQKTFQPSTDKQKLNIFTQLRTRLELAQVREYSIKTVGTQKHQTETQ